MDRIQPTKPDREVGIERTPPTKAKRTSGRSMPEIRRRSEKDLSEKWGVPKIERFTGLSAEQEEKLTDGDLLLSDLTSAQKRNYKAYERTVTKRLSQPVEEKSDSKRTPRETVDVKQSSPPRLKTPNTPRTPRQTKGKRLSGHPDSSEQAPQTPSGTVERLRPVGLREAPPGEAAISPQDRLMRVKTKIRGQERMLKGFKLQAEALKLQTEALEIELERTKQKRDALAACARSSIRPMGLDDSVSSHELDRPVDELKGGKVEQRRHR